MLRSYIYNSCLAPLIEELIKQKRLAGYSYEFEAYILKVFDDYCIQKRLSEPVIKKELLQDWSERHPTESKGYRSQRVSFVRQLSLYMNSLGIKSYVPNHFSEKEKHVPHILSDEEVASFFKETDAYWPLNSSAPFPRMAMEYKVLFRLIYCCGLRNSEACSLKASDVDLDNGVITIIHSKGDKNRLVYLPEDLRMLCQEYWKLLNHKLGAAPLWFFPGRVGKFSIPKTSVDRKFNEFWHKTTFAENCDKKPTVHSLRHTFVVKRMNLWMEQGIELNVMMPYLSKHLGHRGKDETFYYYHQVDKAFQTIRKKDRFSGLVIPEVHADES